MLGMVRLRIDERAPRARVDRTEVLGGTPFVTAVLQLRGTDSLLDRIMIRQALRLLSIRGVSAVATPDNRYINAQLARYNMVRLEPWPLMRRLAGQMLDKLLERRSDAAALLYARRIDGDVLDAACHAAQYYRHVMLDFGAYGESVRRRLMDEMGACVLLRPLPCDASRTAALLFDAPPPGYAIRLRRATTVALCAECAEQTDWNGLQVQPGLYEPLGDTDREAVLAAVASNNPAMLDGFLIGSLIKK